MSVGIQRARDDELSEVAGLIEKASRRKIEKNERRDLGQFQSEKVITKGQDAMQVRGSNGLASLWGRIGMEMQDPVFRPWLA